MLCSPPSRRPSRRCLVHDDGTVGGFAVRAPWGGCCDDRARLEDAEALLHTRRVGGAGTPSEPACWRRTKLAWPDCSRPAGRRRGARPGSSAAMRCDWQPEAIWGQFNFAMG